jgi:hypothetical protein
MGIILKIWKTWCEDLQCIQQAKNMIKQHDFFLNLFIAFYYTSINGQEYLKNLVTISFCTTELST